MKIIIDKPKVEDAYNIQDVLFKTWLATYPNKKIGITAEDIEERFKNRFSDKVIKKRIKDISNISRNKLFLIAKNGTNVVGVCKIAKKRKYNQLEAIYVLPEYQGKGIGNMFWRKAIEFFGTKKDIIVQVAVYNRRAIKFYKKIGFVDSGRRLLEEKFKMPISGKYISEMEMIIKSDKNKAEEKGVRYH